ncbi:MAG TPA: M17 family peptidase N-terminal domain-containing protein [Euzebyales bacterium]|nr:M17 family peptidase N-terminal domain-containing protein [Euzebyales bacterium]
MTAIEIAGGDPLDRPAGTLVVGVFTGGIEGPGVAAVIGGLGLPSLPLTPSFRGDIGQHLLLASPGLPCATVLFVGLGRMVATDATRLREAARVAASTGALSGHVVTTLALVHPSAAAIGAVAEGFLLGAAHRTRLGGEAPGRPAVDLVTILAPTAMRADGEHAVRRASATAAATLAARDLVDVPPNMQPPAVLARQIIDLTAGVCGADLHHQPALERAGFGGMIGAGQGAGHPPCLLELRYEPTDPLGHVVLCGRGTTFASGGLGLRRDHTMTTAKADMAGAAVIAAACAGLAALDVRVRVTALLGLVERMPGGDAQRPGDVVTTRGGTTIEVTNANADAVLVLADLVDLARAYEPDAIVDIATVGGGTATALGRDAGAVMGTDDRLVHDLLAAADTAGEPLWRLPLWDHMDRVLTSPVADVVNDRRTTGGAAIVAGLILRRVARDVPWAHIDCGDAAFVPDLSDDDHGRRPGATGYGARTLLAWLEHRTT